MTINIICETAPGFSFHYKKLAKDVIVQSLDTEGFPYEAEVNLEWMEGAGENPVLRVITAIQLTEKEKQ